MVAAPAASPGKVRQHLHADPVNLRLARAKSPSGPRPGFSGDAARVARSTSISLHIAFRSPEGHDARSAENDWLRAGKRAMCVSIF